jgi:hypothetical protein
MWNFHFLWMNSIFVWHIHKKICESKVPTIKYVVW